MNYYPKPFTWIIAAAFLVAASLWILDIARAKQETSMVKIGGEKNQCSCTQRIER